MSLQSQIENYTGSLPAGVTNNILKSILSSGISDIIRKVKLSSPGELWLFTKTDTVPTAGLGIGTSDVYDVHVLTAEGLFRGCTQIPIDKRYQASDADSINYATGEFPVWYLNDGTLHVLPTPRTSDTEFVTAWAQTDGSNDNTTITLVGALSGLVAGDYIHLAKSDESTSSVTNRYYIGVHKTTYVSGTTVVIEKDYNDEVEVTNYSASTTYAVCSRVYNVKDSDIDTALSSVSNFPDSYRGPLVLFGAIQVLQRRISDMYNSLPTLSLPAVPIAPILEETNITVDDFVVSSPYIAPVPPSGGTVDYSSVPATPTPSSVMAPPITSFTFPISSISVGNLTIDNLPAAPISPDFDSGAVDFATTVRGVAPTYTKPVILFPDFPAVNSLDLPAAPVGPGGPDFSDAQTTVADSNIPVYIPAIPAELDFDQVTSFIETEEDSELAAAQIQKITTKLTEMQAKSQEQLNLFNADMNEYKSKIEQAIHNANKGLESGNLEYQAQLSQYQADVQTYQIETNNILAQWGKEEIENKFSKWAQECNNSLQQFQQDIQNELNKFNRETSIYQAEIQKSTGDSQGKLTSDMNEYQSILAKYQAEVQAYQAKTTNQVTEWTSNEVQVAITEFNTKRNDELQKWNTENSLALQKHTQEVQDEANKIGNDISIWNAEIQKALGTFQAEDASILQKYQALVQNEIGRYESDLKQSLEKYNTSIAKLNADVSRITEENQSRLAKSNFDLQAYTAESQNVIQEFTADLAKDEKEFNFYINQHQVLKAEYEAAFMVQQNKEQ